MEDMKKTYAFKEGNGNADFTFPCGGFEKIYEMMGKFVKDKNGSFDCGEMMKKCCGGKKETCDLHSMMQRMGDPSSERPARK